MYRRMLTLLAFAVVAQISIALADDEIYIKGKAAKVKGIITGETAKGISTKGGDKYSAEDIDDIFYEVGAANPAIVVISYRNGFQAEREWLDTTKDAKVRAAKYTDALDKLDKAQAQVTDAKVKIHLDFKTGYMRGKKALEDGSDPKNAITRLRGFVSKYPNSWQVTRALMLLAKLQLDSKDTTGAEQSYGELAKLDVSEDVKQEAQVQVAVLNIQLKKYAVAEAKLADLAKSLPKGSKHLSRVLVAQAECLTLNNKTPEAIEILKKVAKETQDKGLKAAAYNTLGMSYFNSDQLKEARWEFLWVDVVYNQDKNEHAKALYYLSHIFDKLAEPEKASDCRDFLSDKGFSGSDYQRKMLKERGK